MEVIHKDGEEAVAEHASHKALLPQIAVMSRLNLIVFLKYPYSYPVFLGVIVLSNYSNFPLTCSSRLPPTYFLQPQPVATSALRLNFSF